MVDVIASDGYNWYTCPRGNDPWRTFTEVFAPFHTFGQQHAKPMIIAEWGGREDPAAQGRKATWIDEASTQIKEWPDIVGVVLLRRRQGMRAVGRQLDVIACVVPGDGRRSVLRSAAVDLDHLWTRRRHGDAAPRRSGSRRPAPQGTGVRSTAARRPRATAGAGRARGCRRVRTCSRYGR